MIHEHAGFFSSNSFFEINHFNAIIIIQRKRIWKKEFFLNEAEDFSCAKNEEGPWITHRSKPT